MYVETYSSIGIRGCLDVDICDPIPLYMYPESHIARAI